tara:strand:- start:401 stop:1135 length:735 start_codon:yes stop_codon:yes gene_type:complete
MNIPLDKFKKDGFNLKAHLLDFLNISEEILNNKILTAQRDLASLHPGSLIKQNASSFYKEIVGDAHILDLASWHLSSSDYISSTLLLIEKFAVGNVLDFGGGIGSHAIFSALQKKVDHVFFVDINETNRKLVAFRAKQLGLEKKISFFEKIEEINIKKFNNIICLDVLEHLNNPSKQLMQFKEYMNKDSTSILNWYFYKGDNLEFPFHIDDSIIVEEFFRTLQINFIEIFHEQLITSRVYKLFN